VIAVRCRVILVISPNSPFGAAVARLRPGGVRPVSFDPAAIEAAAPGCSAIVIGGLPEDWRDWAPVVDAAVEASTATRAPVVHHVGLDGLKVIYGVPLPAVAPKGQAIDEIGPEGRLANLLEDQLQQHAELHGLRVILVRSGDLFGPGLAQGYGAEMARAVRSGRALPWYGARDLAHAFTYVDDVARLALRMLEVEGRPPFEVVNVPSHVVTAEEWRRALGASGVRGVPHLLVRARALVDPAWKPLAAGLWGWEGSVLLDERPTQALVPDFTPTPLPEAVAASLAGG
jgi:hypothetical protein